MAIVPVEYRFIKREIALACYHAAFDESGKGDCPYAVFAGLIALPSSWSNFQNEWLAALGEKNLAHWHTVKAKAWFKGRELELFAFGRRLAEIICRHAIGGTVHSITMGEYKKLPEKRLSGLKSPCHAAFNSGLKAMLNFERAPGDTVTLICDDSDDAVHCHELYRAFRRFHKAEARHIAGICFHDDKVCPPLQAADLFAYCYREKFEEGTDHWREVMAIFDREFSIQSEGDLRV